MSEKEEFQSEERILVLPGEELGDDSFKFGTGTYRKGNRIFASQVGIKNIRSGYINVVPLAGKYLPRPGDSVIGIIQDFGPSSWRVNINCPYPAMLHANDSPWKVDYGDTARFLNVGAVILAKISQVDETKRVQITMKEHGLRRLSSGLIVRVSHSKVPRVIGRGGSMISLLKDHTGCRIFVGQNGNIWLDGDKDRIMLASKVIDMIEREAQVMGLTDRVREFLQAERLETDEPAEEIQFAEDENED